MGMRKGLWLILGLSFVALLLSGCISQIDDKTALTQFVKLQQKYFVKEGFSTNSTTMSDYISALVTLREKNVGSPGRIIEAELYSAEAFYYMNKAVVSTSAIPFPIVSCSSKDVKDAIASIRMASDYQAKAVNALMGLSADELKNLREGQLDFVRGYSEQLTQMNDFFDKKC